MTGAAMIHSFQPVFPNPTFAFLNLGILASWTGVDSCVQKSGVALAFPTISC